ncbi:MAG: DUF6502 family protein [Burkholderiaceae bacterium]
MNLRHALTAAVLHLLRPLVRVLLRHGMAYDDFAELARRAYVDVAERDFALRGRKQTTSRISVITGLNRKEVARLQAPNAQDEPGNAAFAATMNRAAKVVVGWQRDHPGDAAADAAATLDAAQFSALVRKYSGDMPVRAVLDELRNAGAVATTQDGRYALRGEGYVPQATDSRKITLLGQHAADLLGTIDHNLGEPAEQAFLQQRVFADNIPAERLDAVRNALRDAGLQALGNARELLITNDAGDSAVAPGARRVTLGVYYSEAPAPAPRASASSPIEPPNASGKAPGEPS